MSKWVLVRAYPYSERVVSEMLYQSITAHPVEVTISQEIVTAGHSRVDELLRLIDTVEDSSG